MRPITSTPTERLAVLSLRLQSPQTFDGLMASTGTNSANSLRPAIRTLVAGKTVVCEEGLYNLAKPVQSHTIYMQKVYNIAKSAEFLRDAAPPTSANYTVDGWDLWRAYESAVGLEIKSAAEQDRARIHRERDPWLIGRDEMQAYIGLAEVYILHHEALARRQWPEYKPQPKPSLEFLAHPLGRYPQL